MIFVYDSLCVRTFRAHAGKELTELYAVRAFVAGFSK